MGYWSHLSCVEVWCCLQPLPAPGPVSCRRPRGKEVGPRVDSIGNTYGPLFAPDVSISSANSPVMRIRPAFTLPNFALVCLREVDERERWRRGARGCRP